MPPTVTPIVERPFAIVKPLQGAALSSNRPPGQPTALTSPLHFSTQLPLIPGAMIHHKVFWYSDIPVYSSRGCRLPSPYGVSPAFRVLSPQVLLKRFDHVRDCLQDVLGLTGSQREAVLRLLRIFAYYGQVYPKASLIAAQPGCSKATYWRTIRHLEALGLIEVINRYIVRPHAQISNLYRLDRLIILIARYLAEHGVHFAERWLEPYLAMAGSIFWRLAWVKDGGTDIMYSSAGAG